MKTPSNNSAAPGPRSDAPSPSHNASLTSGTAEPMRRFTSPLPAFRQKQLVRPAQGQSNSSERLIPAIVRPDLKDRDQIEIRPVVIPHSLFDLEENCHAPL